MAGRPSRADNRAVAVLRLHAADDLAHPGLEPYATLRRRQDLARAARFVAEGEGVVRRLLASRCHVESLLTTEERFAALRPLLDARDDVMDVFLAAQVEGIHRVTGFRSERVKAVGRLRAAATLDAVLRDAPRPRLFFALDGVANAENVGVVARNAAGLGAGALVVGETSCSAFLTRAVRTSMGAVFHLPVVEDLPLLAALSRLRAEGVRVVAAHPAGAVALPDVDLRGDVCVVLGSEGHGLSAAALSACDVAAAVPMATSVDSLNVASAAAAFAYEAWRQRRGAGPAVPGG